MDYEPFSTILGKVQLWFAVMRVRLKSLFESGRRTEAYGERVRFSDNLFFRFLVPSYLLMFVILVWRCIERSSLGFLGKPTERGHCTKCARWFRPIRCAFKCPLSSRQVMFAFLNLNLRGWKAHTQTCNKSQELRKRSLNFFFYLFIAFFLCNLFNKLYT